MNSLLATALRQATPWLLAVETRRDAVSTADHLSRRAQQILS